MRTNIDERIMNGKEVLERLEDNGRDYLLSVRGFKIIKQDLERLEKLEEENKKLTCQLLNSEANNKILRDIGIPRYMQATKLFINYLSICRPDDFDTFLNTYCNENEVALIRELFRCYEKEGYYD